MAFRHTIFKRLPLGAVAFILDIYIISNILKPFHLEDYYSFWAVAHKLTDGNKSNIISNTPQYVTKFWTYQEKTVAWNRRAYRVRVSSKELKVGWRPVRVTNDLLLWVDFYSQRKSFAEDISVRNKWYFATIKRSVIISRLLWNWIERTWKVVWIEHLTGCEPLRKPKMRTRPKCMQVYPEWSRWGWRDSYQVKSKLAARWPRVNSWCMPILVRSWLSGSLSKFDKKPSQCNSISMSFMESE